MNNLKSIQCVTRTAVLRTLLVLSLLAIPNLLVQAQETVIEDLLEQAIYEQQTVGNPTVAIDLYKQVIEASRATRSMAAEALYRTGKCYLELGDTEKANQSFSAVVNQYADIKKFHDLAKAELDSTFAPLAAPWVDGERLEYEITVNNLERVLSRYFVTSYQSEWNQAPAWTLYARASNNNGRVKIVVDAETYRPLHSEADNHAMPSAIATWTESELQIQRENSDKVETYPLESVVYDAEQQLWLVRQMPLTVGKKISYSHISTLISTRAMPLEFEVVSEETITVKAGTFDAYKLTTQLGLVEMWISKGPERYLVKMSTPQQHFDLASIQRVSRGTWRTEESELSDINFSLPDEWVAALGVHTNKIAVTKTVNGEKTSDSKTTTFERYDLMDESGIYGATVFVVDYSELESYDQYLETLPERVENGTEKILSQREAFAVREDTKRDYSINGMQAHSFIADAKRNGTDEVTYAIFINHGNKVIYLIASVPSDSFDNSVIAQMDEIAATIKNY